MGEVGDEGDDEGEGEQQDDEIDGGEKCGNGNVCDDTIEEDKKGEKDGEQLEDGEKANGERIPAAITGEHTDLTTTTETDTDVGTGMIDTILTILVRIVLASVWIAVILGWILERISDVLAIIIELGLVWMPHRDGRL